MRTTFAGGSRYELCQYSLLLGANAREQLTLSGELSKEWLPATVIDFSEEQLPLTASSVEDKFKKFSASDDVFNPNFSGLLIIQTNAKAEKFSVPVGIKAHIQETIWNDRIPEGPYFVKGSSVHQAWRLYPDQLNSFMAATVPDDAVPYK